MTSKSKTDVVPVAIVNYNERITSLREQFCKDFGENPLFFVRVPGRVNIIGEHIDYCGYPVLPMALEQDILVAVGKIDELILCIRNVDDKYGRIDAEITSFEDIDIKPDSNGKPFWYNYILCGIKGAMEHLKNKIKYGLQLCIDGNIPPASGLSSSSALVSAACLAFLYAQDEVLSKTDIASLCAKSERYIGTQGGGMDQAIAFLAEKFSAQYITFNPLNATAVALPTNACFVVAHSLAEANKAATNDFNRRVIECRLAAKIIGTCAGVPSDNRIITLSEVQRIVNNTLEEMIQLVHKYLPKNVYTKNEICQILKISEDEINNLYMTPNTKHLTEFKLKQRALHVFEEASRVENFRKICTQITVNGNAHLSNGSNGLEKCNIDKNNIINVLGKLMSDSHDSLKDLYECSHDNLDRLVNISREMNVHSRLTGAGWGGCIVALCPKEHVDQYIKTLKEEFYEKFCKVDKAQADFYVFATTPNYGATIYVDKLE